VACIIGTLINVEINKVMNKYKELFNKLKEERAVNTDVNDHIMVFDGL